MSFVNKITSEDYVSYTMRLVEPSNTTSSYSNIVIQEHDGIEEIFTIKYTDNSSSRGNDSMNVKPGIIPYDGWEDLDGDGTGDGGNQYVCTTVAGVVEIQCTGTNSHYVYQDADCTCQRFNQAGVFDNCDRAYYDLVLEEDCVWVDANGNPVSYNPGHGGETPPPSDEADIITKKVKLQIPDSEFLPLVECIQPTPAQLTWLNEQNLQGGSNELAAIWGFVNPHDSNDCDEKRPFIKEVIDFYLIDNWKEKLKEAIANGVTSTAEITHLIYKKLAEIANEYPSSIVYINNIVDEFRNIVLDYIDVDPDTCSWGDLFNMWLFELGPNPILINDSANTINSLKNQEGVNEARNIVIAKIQNNDFSDTNHPWTFGQEEFYEGMANGNIQTAFLGSYSTKVQVTQIGSRYQLTFTITNTSSWSSATRFRIDNDGDGVHDGIFENTFRNNPNSINLGGDFEQKWTWKEDL